MADLIIKPSSGNNLVVQGGDSSPAITVGVTGTTTFAENATLSGTANVYGAGTFPAGHVVQTIMHVNTSQVTAISITSFDTTNKMVMGTFTPLFASSDILLIGTIASMNTANSAIVYIDFYKNASDVTETGNITGKTQGLIQSDDAGVWQTSGISYLDPVAENSTSEKTYGFSLRSENSGGSAYIGYGSNTYTTLIIQEIAR